MFNVLRLFNEQGWAAYQHINNIYARGPHLGKSFGRCFMKLISSSFSYRFAHGAFDTVVNVALAVAVCY